MTSLLPPVQSVLELFRGPLSHVRFADIDAAGLASLAAEVELAAGEVQQHEAQLTALRQSLAQRQEALLLLAQRALAYARVYAENDEPLLDELNRISLPRAAKPRKPAGTKAGGAGLPRLEPSTGEGSAAEASAAGIDSEVDAGGIDAVSTDGVHAARRAVRKGRGPAPQPASH